MSPNGKHIEESEVVALRSVDYESASRLEFDRSQRSRVNLSNTLNPTQADQAFMSRLLPLLRKVQLQSTHLLEACALHVWTACLDKV